MILRPRPQDLKTIGYYIGRILIGLSLTMLVPLVVGIFFKEPSPTIDFAISAQFSLLVGILLCRFCRTEKDLNWMHGMIVVSLSWLVAMFIGALPLFLSGHWKSYLDACFEAMSCFATTGLTLVQDLDHLSHAHNFWRHFSPFIGGQGIAIIALTFLVKGASGGFTMYVGEGREEKILPNVIHTSRFIWLISIVYLVVGTIALGLTGIFIGMKPLSSFFHAVCIFMAGFDTAGFAPRSQNILYYHSMSYELIIMVIMILGTLNFNLHYQVWLGNRKEILKNIESRIFLVLIIFAFSVAAFGLSRLGIYNQALILFRKGFFQLISAHTTTGYGTIYAKQFITDWGNLALIVLIFAMALGGCACSTAGGIKMLRVGIIFKALKEDLKRIILPGKAIVAEKFHHIKDVFLVDKQVRAVFLITVCYLALYALGAAIGVFLGYPFLESLFESTSASANVGFSCGITDAAMPAALKVTYIIQMWAGRLEFISVFAIFGFIVGLIKGK